MLSITTTTDNNKTVFSAQVTYRGESFMVYGFAPPAPKSTYILVSGNKVGTAGVPDEVAKAIYSRLKSGKGLVDNSTFTNPGGSRVIQSLETTLSRVSGATVNFTQTEDYRVVLNLLYPDGVEGIVDICLLPSKGMFSVSLNNGMDTNVWYDDFPRSIYYRKSFFKLSKASLHKFGRYGESIQGVLTAIAPYIITQQKALYPPLEEAFPGFKLKSTVDKTKLDRLVSYVTSLPYADFQVYVDGNKYSANCKYEWLGLEEVTEYFVSNNIAILCQEEKDSKYSQGMLAFGYGNKISKELAQNSIFGYYDMEDLVYAPDVLAYLNFTNHYVCAEGSRFSLSEIGQVQGIVGEATRNKRGADDNTAEKLYKLITDQNFISLLDSVQQSAK